MKNVIFKYALANLALQTIKLIKGFRITKIALVKGEWKLWVINPLGETYVDVDLCASNTGESVADNYTFIQTDILDEGATVVHWFYKIKDSVPSPGATVAQPPFVIQAGHTYFNKCNDAGRIVLRVNNGMVAYRKVTALKLYFAPQYSFLKKFTEWAKYEIPDFNANCRRHAIMSGDKTIPKSCHICKHGPCHQLNTVPPSAMLHAPKEDFDPDCSIQAKSNGVTLIPRSCIRCNLGPCKHGLPLVK